MLPARINWELALICERIQELVPDYEKNKPARQEHITKIKHDVEKMRVLIIFNTYLYEITHPERSYVITWYRKKENKAYEKDGFVECEDLARVVQTIDSYLYGAFNPDRSPWWQLHERPKHFSRKRNWGH